MNDELEFDIDDIVKLSDNYFEFFRIHEKHPSISYGQGKISKIISGGEDGVVEVKWFGGAVTSLSCDWLDKVEDNDK